MFKAPHTCAWSFCVVSAVPSASGLGQCVSDSPSPSHTLLAHGLQSMVVPRIDGEESLPLPAIVRCWQRNADVQHAQTHRTLYSSAIVYYVQYTSILYTL